MNRILTALTGALVAALVFTTAAVAQLGCTPLVGVIHDSTAAVIPGASVQLDSSVPILSDPSGRFRIACVTAGRHTLHIAFSGFSGLSIAINVPHPRDLSIALRPEEVQTTVTVGNNENAAANNSPLATGPTQTISGQRLQTLADDPDDLLRELQQMSAAAGGNPSSAAISIDGFHSGDNNATLPPKSTIAYIKVNPDLFSAEYRNPPFGGGEIQVYTKPGQPAYHGDLFTTNSSSWMNARDPFSVSSAAIGKQRYGFDLTGPIHKKGSDFVLSLEHRSIDNFAVVNAVGVDASGDQTPILENVPAPQRLWIGMAKTDWQLGSKNTFIASLSAYHNRRQNVGAGGTTLAEAAYDNEQYENDLHLTDVTTISSKLMHESRLEIDFDGKDETPNSLSPQVQVAGAFTSGGSTSGALRDHETDAEFDDDAILSLSKHLMKFGTQSELLRERFRYYNNFNGTWLFGGGIAPVLDANNHPTAQTEILTGVQQYVRALNGWAGGSPTEFSSAAGSPTINLTQYREALFFQDDWTLHPRLHFAWGLRYYTQNKPMVHNNFNPRFGMSWAPDKDSTWTIHGHVGLFSGRFSAHAYGQLLDMDGVQRVTSLIYTPTCPGVFNPDTCDAFTGATPIDSVRTIQPHLPNLFYSIQNLGFSHTIRKSWIVSADYYTAQLWHDTRSENINYPTNDQPLGPRPLEPDVDILQWQSSGRGYGNVIFMGLNNQSLKYLQFNIGAVRVHVIDDTDDSPFTNPQTTGSNLGEYARRTSNPLWNVFGNATAKLPLKLQLSANFNAQGDSPYNITTGFDNNGDGDFNDRPYFAPAGTSVCSATITANCAYATQFGLLTTTGTGATLRRNAGNLPWTTYLDTNLQRTFKFTLNPNADHPQSLTANIRSSNVLNHLNVTAVGGVVGSPLFSLPYSGDNGRRVEGGLRYNF